MDILNAVGRRKRAIARVYLSEGKGSIVVNNKDYKEYFPTVAMQDAVVKPLETTGFSGKFDIKIAVLGGGINGQAEAVKLGIARALVKMDPEQRPVLKTNNLLRRDPRQVERKKPGQPKARKKFQFSKR